MRPTAGVAQGAANWSCVFSWVGIIGLFRKCVKEGRASFTIAQAASDWLAPARRAGAGANVLVRLVKANLADIVVIGKADRPIC